jgi:predicted RNase H-like HicB family nuclease
MTKRKYVYPAVFTQEGDAYSVIFPDLEIATSGETLVEAIDMA